MCHCDPRIRTPNCGSVACAAAERAGERVLSAATGDVLTFLRSEAKRFRERNEGADAAVAAHVEILADQIKRGEHRGARFRVADVQGATEKKEA